MSDTDVTQINFKSLGVPAPVLKALDDVGYETPSPIQAKAIPSLLAGGDILGHAPTGTGKTAAFSLPLLARLDLRSQGVQVLVLTPTRELAIQVSEAFQRYAKYLKGFHVLPIYGGQEYGGQIRALKRGLHVVVGTPGRVMDHMRKGTLQLDNLKTLVLDEADEMLRMGFLEDVEWILSQCPENRQIALFSATMPKDVKRIAKQYLRDPEHISIEAKTATAELINQRYSVVKHTHKLDALTRILEVEPFDAILLFVRTKLATAELAERLQARGFAAEALNGDMAQRSREQMVNRLKKGHIDILVATDVAARGLDVERISHVINYDIPYDSEAYIHRIGRTGRAGRKGEAILFVTPREKRMLAAIEKATRKTIEKFDLPTTDKINMHRVNKFKQGITDTIEQVDLEELKQLLAEYLSETDGDAVEVMAALAKMSLRDQPLLMSERDDSSHGTERVRPHGKVESPERADRGGQNRKPAMAKGNVVEKRRSARKPVPDGMQRYRIAVGHNHKVEPKNIVGAIVNEAGLDGEHVGHIDIHEDFSLVDLPEGMPREIFRDLKKTWVCGQKLRITLEEPAKRQRKTAPALTQAESRPRKRKVDNAASATKSPSRKPSKKKGK